MTALATFSFQGFTLRPTGKKKDDLRIADEWTKADPDHRDTTQGWFWLEQRSGVESYVLEDKYGTVFFFKIESKPKGHAEVHIQFPPSPLNASERAEQRDRVMRGLRLGFEWLEKTLAGAGVNALYFTSRSPQLIRFTTKRMGFVQEDGRLVHRIGPEASR